MMGGAGGWLGGGGCPDELPPTCDGGWVDWLVEKKGVGVTTGVVPLAHRDEEIGVIDMHEVSRGFLLPTFPVIAFRALRLSHVHAQ